MNHTAFTVFVLPFLIGAIIRSMLLKWKKGYTLSVALALISIMAWIWTNHLVNHGVDGTVMLWALMAAELTVGSLIVGGISFLVKRMKR